MQAWSSGSSDVTRQAAFGDPPQPVSLPADPTSCCVAAMLLLLGLCGWAAGGRQEAGRALSDLMANAMSGTGELDEGQLRQQGARRLDPVERQALLPMLGALCDRAGLAAPDVYILPQAVPNAFAVGRPGRCAILVTAGLLQVLNGHEMAGVLAHELGHIVNRDPGLLDFAGRLNQAVAASAVGALVRRLSDPHAPALGGMASAALWLVLLLTPFLSNLLQLALSRLREFEADRMAARLAGRANGLVDALCRLEALNLPQSSAQAASRNHPLTALLRTHPEGHQRIRRLQAQQAMAAVA